MYLSFTDQLVELIRGTGHEVTPLSLFLNRVWGRRAYNSPRVRFKRACGIRGCHLSALARSVPLVTGARETRR